MKPTHRIYLADWLRMFPRYGESPEDRPAYGSLEARERSALPGAVAATILVALLTAPFAVLAGLKAWAMVFALIWALALVFFGMLGAPVGSAHRGWKP